MRYSSLKNTFFVPMSTCPFCGSKLIRFSRSTSAKKTQNDFSLLLITEMCPVPFRFSLLQQDPADRRFKFFDRRQRQASSYVRNIFITTRNQPKCNIIRVRAYIEVPSFKCVVEPALPAFSPVSSRRKNKFLRASGLQNKLRIS